MESAERETIILINDADLEDGFFRISTTKKQVYESLLKRIGPDDVVFTKVTLSVNGTFAEGNIRCRAQRAIHPRLYVSHGNRHRISDQERANRSARGKELAARNFSKPKKEKNNAR